MEDEMNDKVNLKMEFTDEWGHRTSIDKDFSYWNDTQFGTLVTEIAYCLLAMGFSEATVRDYIEYE